MKELGFIGFGEAAINFASGIAQQDPSIRVAVYDKFGISETAKHLNVDILIANSPEDLLGKVETIIVAIPGSMDLEMFQAMYSAHFKDKLIIDFCTAKPEHKFEISKIVDSVGGFYVDVAALGSFPALKHKVPMLISGKGSEKMIRTFSGFGLNLKVMSDKAGDAMVVKLCRSIYMKGLAALAIEMTEVSEAYGVKDQVWASLAESMDNDQFMVYTPRLINGTIRNLLRRTKEVEECIDLINRVGKNGTMTEATHRFYILLNNNK